MFLSMRWMHEAGVRYILLAITVFVMAWAGRRIYTGAWTAARHGSADMNALVALGTEAAFCTRWRRRSRRNGSASTMFTTNRRC